jgi:hypothetical protein
MRNLRQTRTLLLVGTLSAVTLIGPVNAAFAQDATTTVPAGGAATTAPPLAATPTTVAVGAAPVAEDPTAQADPAADPAAEATPAGGVNAGMGGGKDKTDWGSRVSVFLGASAVAGWILRRRRPNTKSAV